MDLGIAGKVALVFGGSKGIGLGCAREFAREGCRTVIAARTKSTIACLTGPSFQEPNGTAVTVYARAGLANGRSVIAAAPTARSADASAST